MTRAQRRVLERAAQRERGNVCPIVNVRVFANAETVLIASLLRQGWITDDRVPYITDAGRSALRGTVNK
jgi:hypothetical protein